MLVTIFLDHINKWDSDIICHFRLQILSSSKGKKSSKELIEQEEKNLKL